MIVDAHERISDRGSRHGKRQECLLVQTVEDAALSKAHGVRPWPYPSGVAPARKTDTATTPKLRLISGSWKLAPA
ncbi:hypothetical protein [Rhizobium sp. RU36D]|uniref:hypothetical protein n=1 Tax=Rhizobium sp. RU36D TaxID=1907415 RepID=UPI0009D8A3B7|nr:hypothetical protein [Rhizobium sp. RU36D]SMC95002.1 hypothetical protein SAMN05880593_111131 [Rhizobium sp. RU36D]